MSQRPLFNMMKVPRLAMALVALFALTHCGSKKTELNPFHGPDDIQVSTTQRPRSSKEPSRPSQNPETPEAVRDSVLSTHSRPPTAGISPRAPGAEPAKEAGARPAAAVAPGPGAIPDARNTNESTADIERLAELGAKSVAILSGLEEEMVAFLKRYPRLAARWSSAAPARLQTQPPSEPQPAAGAPQLAENVMALREEAQWATRAHLDYRIASETTLYLKGLLLLSLEERKSRGSEVAFVTRVLNSDAFSAADLNATTRLCERESAGQALFAQACSAASAIASGRQFVEKTHWNDVFVPSMQDLVTHYRDLKRALPTSSPLRLSELEQRVWDGLTGDDRSRLKSVIKMRAQLAGEEAKTSGNGDSGSVCAGKRARLKDEANAIVHQVIRAAAANSSAVFGPSNPGAGPPTRYTREAQRLLASIPLAAKKRALARLGLNENDFITLRLSSPPRIVVQATNRGSGPSIAAAPATPLPSEDLAKATLALEAETAKLRLGGCLR